jgi:hypothetical protein
MTEVIQAAQLFINAACFWCGKPLAKHVERRDTFDPDLTPCQGLKSNFLSAATIESRWANQCEP